MTRLVITANGANTKGLALAADDLEERIIRRTYELYKQQGRKDRSYVGHWVQAMRELAGGRPRKSADQ